MRFFADNLFFKFKISYIHYVKTNIYPIKCSLLETLVSSTRFREIDILLNLLTMPWAYILRMDQ